MIREEVWLDTCKNELFFVVRKHEYIQEQGANREIIKQVNRIYGGSIGRFNCHEELRVYMFNWCEKIDEWVVDEMDR